jgi:two-component system nitrate/nitrite response regulator NarL
MPGSAGKRTLTGRELEVVALLARGISNKEVARELEISHRTVEAHRQRIYTKLGISSTAELVTYAIDNDLI